MSKLTYEMSKTLVSNEAALLNNLQEALSRHFSKFVDHTKFALNSILTRLEFREAGFAPSANTIRHIKTLNYLDIAELKFEVPEGLNVPFTDYLTALTPAQERASRFQKEMLRPLLSFCGSVINDRAARQIPKDISSVFEEGKKDRQQLSENLGQCFRVDGIQTSQPYSKLFKRNSDWDLVASQTNHLQSIFRATDIKGIENDVNALIRYLESLLKLVEKEDFKNANPKIANELSESVYECAKELEFVATTHYRSSILISCVENAQTFFKSYKA